MRALEDGGARFTLGIPGTHNIETYFTRSAVAATLRRLPLGDRLRMLARAAGRHVAGALAARPRER